MPPLPPKEPSQKDLLLEVLRRLEIVERQLSRLNSEIQEFIWRWKDGPYMAAPNKEIDDTIPF